MRQIETKLDLGEPVYSDPHSVSPSRETSAPTPIHLSEDYLSGKTYWGVRNRAGAVADTLEGIASMGRYRVAAIPHVGLLKMKELDEVLASVGISWGGKLPAGATSGPRVGGSAKSVPKVSVLDPASAAVEELISTARSLDHKLTIRTARALSATLAETPGVTPRSEACAVGLLLEGDTLRGLGKRLDISGERVRQLTAWIPSAHIKVVREAICRALVAENADAIASRHRDGATVAEIAEGELLKEFGISKSQLIAEIERSVLTTRDRTINHVRSGTGKRSATERWSDVEIYDGLRRVGKVYCPGGTPSTTQYEEVRQAEAGFEGTPYTLPSIPLVVSRCGSWSAALQRSGFDVTVRGSRSDRVWTVEECFVRLLDLVRELDELPSVERYELIQQERPSYPDSLALPSSATVRNRLRQIGLGKWEAIRACLVQRLLDNGEW